MSGFKIPPKPQLPKGEMTEKKSLEYKEKMNQFQQAMMAINKQEETENDIIKMFLR